MVAKKKLGLAPPETASPRPGLIFISWAGSVSHSVAKALKELIQSTIQKTEPWVSSADIDKGARWRSEIQATLDAAVAGIVVLSPSGMTQPWMLFEAGALSKKQGRVYTYLFRLKQVDDPLAQFQRTLGTKDETFAMLRSINLLIGNIGIQEPLLEKAFQQNWGEFEAQLNKISKSEADDPTPSVQEKLLGEALAYLREHGSELATIKGILRGATDNALLGLPAAALDVLSGRSTSLSRHEMEEMLEASQSNALAEKRSRSTNALINALGLGKASANKTINLPPRVKFPERH